MVTYAAFCVFNLSRPIGHHVVSFLEACQTPSSRFLPSRTVSTGSGQRGGLKPLSSRNEERGHPSGCPRYDLPSSQTRSTPCSARWPAVEPRLASRLQASRIRYTRSHADFGTEYGSRHSQRRFVADRGSALSRFAGRLVRLSAASAMSPGSAGCHPAKRNYAGKMPALPGEAPPFTNTFSSLIRLPTAANPVMVQLDTDRNQPALRCRPGSNHLVRPPRLASRRPPRRPRRRSFPPASHRSG
jgi:hypothetical protein